MSNRTVPATAEGMSKPTHLRLEDPINDAQQFAELADYVTDSILGEAVSGGRETSVQIMSWERDLIRFATLQAKLAASRATKAFYSVNSAHDEEGGR